MNTMLNPQGRIGPVTFRNAAMILIAIGAIFSLLPLALPALTALSYVSLVLILNPLGMTNTETSFRRARAMPDLARGYTWHKETGTIEEPEQNVRGINSLDTIAPAGSISSTALDMAKWLRFLLARGEVNGKPRSARRRSRRRGPGRSP